MLRMTRIIWNLELYSFISSAFQILFILQSTSVHRCLLQKINTSFYISLNHDVPVQLLPFALSGWQLGMAVHGEISRSRCRAVFCCFPHSYYSLFSHRPWAACVQMSKTNGASVPAQAGAACGGPVAEPISLITSSYTGSLWRLSPLHPAFFYKKKYNQCFVFVVGL